MTESQGDKEQQTKQDDTVMSEGDPKEYNCSTMMTYPSSLKEFKQQENTKSHSSKPQVKPHRIKKYQKKNHQEEVQDIQKHLPEPKDYLHSKQLQHYFQTRNQIGSNSKNN
eukprot:7179232-Ditylum_brightwellii.AAC.1